MRITINAYASSLASLVSLGLFIAMVMTWAAIFNGGRF